MKLGTHRNWGRITPQQSFAEPRLNLVVGAIVGGTAAGFFLASAALVIYRSTFRASIVLILAGAIFAFITYLIARRARAAFGSHNWVIRIVPQGVLLQFRPLEKRGLGDDAASVVLLERTDVRSVAKRTERRYVADADAETQCWATESFLEIRLSHGDTAQLARAMRTQQLESLFDVPMWLAKPNVIRVRFHSPPLRPKLDEALRVLGRYFPVDPPVERELKDWRKLGPEEARAYAHLMLERGKPLEAAAVLNERCGCKGSTAATYVDSRRLEWAGLCPACGYDLRATPNRCPECGYVAGGPHEKAANC